MLKNVHFYTDKFLKITQNNEYFTLDFSLFIHCNRLLCFTLISHTSKNIIQPSKNKRRRQQILK